MTEPRPGVDPATNEMRWNEALTEVVQLRTDRAYWKSLTAARTERVNALEAEVDRLRADLADAQRRIATAVSIHSGVHHCVGARLYAGNGNHPPSTAIPGLCPTVAAFSAGGGGPDEGGGR